MHSGPHQPLCTSIFESRSPRLFVHTTSGTSAAIRIRAALPQPPSRVRTRDPVPERYMPPALPRDRPPVPCIVSPEPSRPGGLVIPSVLDGEPVRPGTPLFDRDSVVEPAPARPAVLPLDDGAAPGSVEVAGARGLLGDFSPYPGESLLCAVAEVAIMSNRAAAAVKCMPAFIVMPSQCMDTDECSISRAPASAAAPRRS
jgi:hypothetical protein